MTDLVDDAGAARTSTESGNGQPRAQQVQRLSKRLTGREAATVLRVHGGNQNAFA
jgi:hypothetical protein